MALSAAPTTFSSVLSLVYDNSQAFGGGDCRYDLGVVWALGREGISDEMEGITNGNVLAFGGVEVQLPIFGPAGADVKGVLRNIMAIFLGP